MKKLLVLLFIIYNLLFGLSNLTFAQDRYVTCDQCGYCPPSEKPSNWESCQQCLYESEDTLKIDETTNLPPITIPGRWYTLVGCINTSGGFQQEGAASSLIQVLLDLVFKTAGGIAFLYFIYGSFIVLTSQSEPEKIIHGRRIITGAIVGLIIALSSVFLVNLLASGFLKIPGFGN